MLRDRLSTASFYGVPFAVLTRAREIAQQRQRVRLIQPAPTLTNDPSGHACLFDDGVSARPDQYRELS